MSTMIQQRNLINNNMKEIFTFLDRQYPTAFDLEEIEQDILTGYSDLETEKFHAYKALTTLKKYNFNNQQKVKTINQYLKLLMIENKIN